MAGKHPLGLPFGVVARSGGSEGRGRRRSSRLKARRAPMGVLLPSKTNRWTRRAETVSKPPGSELEHLLCMSHMLCCMPGGHSKAGACGGGDPGPGQLLLAGSYPKDGLQPGPHRGQTAGTRHRAATRGGEATGIRQRAPAGGQGQGGGATGGLWAGRECGSGPGGTGGRSAKGAPPANVPSQEADGAGERHSEGALAACGGGVCQGGPTPESGGVHFGGSRRSGLRKPRGGL